MSAVWVDTDFGFDDLWALLLLQKIGCPVAGVSLVAGNTPLAQVAANAVGSKAAYGFDWPVWRGAARPLKRAQETAQRILGATGMRSRGVRLPDVETDPPPEGAVDAMGAWLAAHSDGKAELLSLGPLTNVAILLQRFPDAIDRLERIVWMGGSAGAGNHTSLAEFNALADPEALAVVLESEVPFDIVDLVFCRGVAFGPDDMPQLDPLTGDLLGGYLDIALERGRSAMAIYDPVAALAIAVPESVGFSACSVTVSTEPGATYGATQVEAAESATTRIATEARGDLASLCLAALKKEALDGPRP